LLSHTNAIIKLHYFYIKIYRSFKFLSNFEKKQFDLKELFFLKNFQSKDEIRITIQFINFYFQISNANKNENILFKIK
jgi:hypothetical protein